MPNTHQQAARETSADKGTLYYNDKEAFRESKLPIRPRNIKQSTHKHTGRHPLFQRVLTLQNKYNMF